MADKIKRLNYFNGLFLREQDFTDEQEYHVRHQRDHNRLLHTAGIAEGLDVLDPAAGATAITITAGIAYDEAGRRIVLPDNKEGYDLADMEAEKAVYVTLAYKEQATDPSDEAGIEGNTRWTEEPLIEKSLTPPSNAAEKLLLAKVERTGQTITKIDRSARRVAGVKGGDLEVLSLTFGSETIAPVGWSRMQLGDAERTDLAGSLKVENNLEVGGTIDGRDVATDGTKLDSHVANANNPHGTTAAQIDAQGGANRIVAQINSGSGVINEARIDTAIARVAKFDVTAGHDHDGVDSKKLTGINSTHFTDLSGAALIGLSGGQITTGTVADARIDAAIARVARFDAASGHDHDGVDSKKLTGINSTHFADLSGAALINLNGSQIASGTVAEARIDPLIARDSEVSARFDLASGHDHDGVDSKKLTGINSTHFADLSGAALTGLSGGQITTGTVADARIDAAIARKADLEEKLNGEFVQGLLTLDSNPGGVAVTVTNKIVSNRLVAIRGWASTTSNGAPGLLTNSWGRWLPLPAIFKEGWTITSTGVGFGSFFTFTEGAVTIDIGLSVGAGITFYFKGPAGTNVGYAFQVTWQ